MRSPQQHVGVVHSSNLCTEITLNTSDDRDRRLQPRLGQPARAPEGRQARPREAEEDDLDRDAHARQRDRHQLLRGQEGARLQPAPPPGRPGHHGLPGLRCTSCASRTRREAAVEFADRSMEAVCYYAYWASTELAARARPLLELHGLAVGQGHPAARHARPARRTSAAATSKSTARPTLDWDALRKQIKAARHAQLQLRRHRADRDHLQHHRRVGLDRAQLRQPLREVEPVGRVHRRQRVPGARPEEAWACGTT